jgi:hypothetical protein
MTQAGFLPVFLVLCPDHVPSKLVDELEAIVLDLLAMVIF